MVTAAWHELLSVHFGVGPKSTLRRLVVTTTGDGMLAAFDASAHAVRCAVSMGLPPAGAVDAAVHVGEVARRTTFESHGLGRRIMARLV
jgi:class 3 adenylate cyclase